MSRPFALVVLLFAGCASTPSQLHPVTQPPVRVAGALTTRQVDTPPRVLQRPPPRYPAALRQVGVRGSAVIDFVVGTDGRVVAASIFRANDIRFGEAARQAVLRWRYAPAEKAGVPVPFHMQVPIVFQIHED